MLSSALKQISPLKLAYDAGKRLKLTIDYYGYSTVISLISPVVTVIYSCHYFVVHHQRTFVEREEERM